MKNFIQKLLRALRLKPRTPTTPDLNTLKDPQVQLALSTAIVHDILKERQSDRNWRFARRLLIGSLMVLGIGHYVYMYVLMSGVHLSTDTKKSIGVVHLSGEITQTSLASSAKVAPALKSAMEDASVKAVAIAIDSPGGSPHEAERINFMINSLRKEYTKPIYASIQNIGASAAYMVAMHTDKICAGKYSLVGSIGAIMSSWDFHRALGRFDVQQDVYASGQLKGMLNPFIAPTDASKAKAQDLVNKAGALFLDELTKQREGKLAKGIKFDTGEIWDGDEALKIGLIDEICTLEKIAQDENSQIKDFGPGNYTVTPFSFSFADALLEAFASRVSLLLRAPLKQPPSLQ